MASDDEIERAKNTMAKGLSVIWNLNGKKPSDRLHTTLDEHPEISVEVWLDTLTRIKDPLLVSHIVQYLNLTDNGSAATEDQVRNEKPLSKRDLVIFLASLAISGFLIFQIIRVFIMGPGH